MVKGKIYVISSDIFKNNIYKVGRSRNFPNRLGKGANVYLASAELSAITAIEGKIPDLNTYLKYFEKIDKNKKDIFNYMNFDKLDDYKK